MIHNLFSLFTHMLQLIHINIVILYVIYPIRLSKEMNIVIAHVQVAHKQSVWRIVCRPGVVHRVLMGVDDPIRRNRRTRTSYISNPIKDDISILGIVGSTASRSSVCSGRILITWIVLDCILARLL